MCAISTLVVAPIEVTLKIERPAFVAANVQAGFGVDPGKQ
jgi:hypothetical protein